MLRCDWTAAWATIMEAARAHGFDRPPPGGAMHRREEEERIAACNTLGLKPQPTHLELRKAYRALALVSRVYLPCISLYLAYISPTSPHTYLPTHLELRKA